MHKVKFVLALATSASAVWLYSSAIQEVILTKSNTIIAQAYGGHLQFLTILGIVTSLFQQVFSVLALLTNLRVLRSIQNVLLMVSAPLEVVISSLYWPLKFYDGSLLLDKRVSQGIGPALDRKLHLYPALLQFYTATVLFQTPWRYSIIWPAMLMATVAGSYWWWFEKTASVNGFYPYPFLGMLTTQQKFGVIAGAGLIALISYKILQIIQSRFH